MKPASASFLSLFAKIVIFAYALGLSAAVSASCLLLTADPIGTPLVQMSSKRYAVLRKSIVDAYLKDTNMETETAADGRPDFETDFTLYHPPDFEIDYFFSAKPDTSHWGKYVLVEPGVLRLSTTSQEWLNFLAYAIYKDDLVQLLKQIHAYRVQLIFFTPEVRLSATKVNLTPVDYRRPGRKAKFTAVEERSAESNTLLKGTTPAEILLSLSQYAYPNSTAVTYVNSQLGFKLDDVIQSYSVNRRAIDILTGLGFEQSPALAHQGYWEARTVSPVELVYKKTVAALIKMHALDLVYVDFETVGAARAPETNVMSRRQFEALGQVQLSRFSSPNQAVGDVSVYQGFAAAIAAIENRGYKFVDGEYVR